VAGLRRDDRWRRRIHREVECCSTDFFERDIALVLRGLTVIAGIVVNGFATLVYAGTIDSTILLFDLLRCGCQSSLFSQGSREECTHLVVQSAPAHLTLASPRMCFTGAQSQPITCPASASTLRPSLRQMVAVPSVGAGGVVAIPPLPYWHRPMKSLEALSGLALAIAMASLPVQPADNGQEFHTHKVLAGPFAAERFAKVVAVIIADTGGGIEPRSANHGAVRHARCGGSSGALRGTLFKCQLRARLEHRQPLRSQPHPRWRMHCLRLGIVCTACGSWLQTLTTCATTGSLGVVPCIRCSGSCTIRRILPRGGIARQFWSHQLPATAHTRMPVQCVSVAFTQ
jgi:hypothetical protein